LDQSLRTFTELYPKIIGPTSTVQPNYYTVGHKKRATFIFTTTLANVDRFQ